MTRRGLTLIELMVTLVVLGLLGMALARLMIGNSRFVGRHEATLEARQNARAAMNLVATELRMVSDGGLLAAAAESVTVRIPYAFGLLCRNTTALRVPADSVVLASAVPGGIAYRQNSGLYAFDPSVTITTGGPSADCTVDGIGLTTGARHITLSRAGIAPPGTIFYLFQVITYKFAPSTQFPGRIGLWRRAGGGAEEELLAPFATTARFAFLVGSRLSVTTTPPSPLSQVAGLELRLVGESEAPPNGASAPTRYALLPRVKFVNRPLP